jgi:hypothetical protein
VIKFYKPTEKKGIAAVEVVVTSHDIFRTKEV